MTIPLMRQCTKTATSACRHHQNHGKSKSSLRLLHSFSWKKASSSGYRYQCQPPSHLLLWRRGFSTSGVRRGPQGYYNQYQSYSGGGNPRMDVPPSTVEFSSSLLSSTTASPIVPNDYDRKDGSVGVPHGSESQNDKSLHEEEIVQSWRWLEQYGPGFAVSGHQVKIIQSPSEFYDCIIEKAQGATRRVNLASLYLGSGPKEHKLVEILRKNGAENKDLEIKVLLDYTRGSRGADVSSRTMLLPLVKECHNCQVYLYHTPQLRGIKKRWLPQRWNEIIGLQHMKIYIFDDSVIISGANLSEDYFTNRQDRYFLVENCKELADFYDDLISHVTDFSFKLNELNHTSLNPEWKVHPSDGSLDMFVDHAQRHVLSFYERGVANNKLKLKTAITSSHKEDTWIFPLIQMGGIGISLDKDATCRIFDKSPTGSHIKLATGYFNLTAEYTNKIIQNSAVSYDILMAHPKANGFFGAKGFAGGIPAAYTLLAKQFLENASNANQMYRLSMSEYKRNEWTYHAKGLWYYPPDDTLPAVTLIGSPNFGHRSVYRDLETQLYVITLNPDLRKRLESEQEYLFSFSKPFVSTEISQPERQVPLWVKLVIVFFRNFF